MFGIYNTYFEAKRLLENAKRDAENIKKEEIFKAKEEIMKSRDELDKEIRERRGEVQSQEKRLIQKWIPIVASSQLSKGRDGERDFLMKWIDVIEFQ